MHLVLFVMAAVLAAQHSSTTTGPTIPPADCSGQPGSCAMFNEMLAAKDEDFSGFQSKDFTTYVCFERQEFFALSFNNPAQPRDPKVAEKQPARLVLFQSYGDGVEREHQSQLFTWYLNQSETHASPDNDETNDSYIDSREVTFVFHFTNIAKGTTTRTIKIRRSTLRFADDSLTSDDKNGRYENCTGYCTVYPK